MSASRAGLLDLASDAGSHWIPRWASKQCSLVFMHASEHVFPRWLNRYLPPNQPQQLEQAR
jgi:hypothetical protein